MLDLLYKIWRNPTWICKKCDKAIREAWDVYPHGDFDLVYETSLFNKNHYHTFKAKENNQVATATKNTVGQWFWHVHHETLVEKATEPIENRISYIRSSKGVSVDTRLHFLRPVISVPAIVTQTDTKVAQLQKVYDAINRAYLRGTLEDGYTKAVRASQALNAAKSANQVAIKKAWEAQHKKECFHYCPWNGFTLLPAVTQGRQ